MSDARYNALKHWLSTLDGVDGVQLQPASSDASFRRYFRLQVSDGKTVIAMDAPPEHEDNAAFIHVASLLADAQVNVPEILAQNLHQGFLLLGDLGQTTYLAAMQASSDEQSWGREHYPLAIDALLNIQQCKADSLPKYDEALLNFEMELFRDWLLQRHLGLKLSDSDNAILDSQFSLLRQNALEQPQCFVHRDYHSRNLMDAPTPGILDFQDAVIGAVTYDLVSLLRDCYVQWPQSQVDEWFDHWFDQAIEKAVFEKIERSEMRRWFDFMGVQRHLKASGIFARLNHRDGKSGYLKDIPLTVGYIRQVAQQYEALLPLLKILDKTPW